jgi:hypothetical protein
MDSCARMRAWEFDGPGRFVKYFTNFTSFGKADFFEKMTLDWVRRNPAPGWGGAVMNDKPNYNGTENGVEP